jgi:hypothetical protein
MFMRLFNSLFDGPGRGCVNRFLARSDLGKGDQQVRVPDVDPNAPALTDGTMGLIEFETVLANCARGNGDKLTGQDKAAEKKAEQAEKKAEKKAEQAERKADKQQAKADKQRGRSDSAPGKNK